MLENWMISLLASLPLFAVTGLWRGCLGSWFAPGAFFGLYWSCVVASILVLLPDYVLTPTGLLWIAGSVLAVGAGNFVSAYWLGVRGLFNLEKYDRTSMLKDRFRGCWLCLGCTMLGLASVCVYIWAAGLSLRDSLSLSNILGVAHYYSFARYHFAHFRESSIAIGLTVFIYFGAFWGGMTWIISTERYQKLIALAPLCPALLVTIVLSTRASFLFAMLFWLSGYLAGCVRVGGINKNDSLGLFTLSRVCMGAGVLVLACLVYMIGYLIRIGGNAEGFHFGFARQLFSAFLGSTSAFTIWASQHFQDFMDFFSPGRATMASLTRWLIGWTRPHYAPIVVGKELYSQSDTTVYTLFRQLIEDFSGPGALWVLVLFGAIAGWSYERTHAGAREGIPFLALCYAITLAGITGSPLAYTTILAGWLLFAFTVTR